MDPKREKGQMWKNCLNSSKVYGSVNLRVLFISIYLLILIITLWFCKMLTLEKTVERIYKNFLQLFWNFKIISKKLKTSQTITDVAPAFMAFAL